MVRATSSDSRDGPDVFTVSALTRDIKRLLETRFTGVWVEGELSNLKRPPSGHVYFTLKDEGSALPSVLFRSAAQRLRFRPEDGMAVLLWGHVTVYEPRGAYQIRVERMEPRGKGALQIAFEQLKEKLAREGLFEAERKLPLPLLPQRLGIVTSPTGAAIRDICRVLHRRFPNLEVVVYPAQVQGALAAAEIAQGVRVFNRLGNVDAIIVTRGGGSLEDLWPFNEEAVARSIAASRIPVVSAVGHEIDVTISDMVADLRAPTPSAAAEMVVASKESLSDRVTELERRMSSAVFARLRDLEARVHRLASHRGFSAVSHGVDNRIQRVDELSVRATSLLERSIGSNRIVLERRRRRLAALGPEERLRRASLRHSELRARLDAARLSESTRAKRALGEVSAKLHALSPLAVLGRGYSLAWTEQGKLLRRANDAAVGDALRIKLDEGELDCRVERIRDET